VGADPDGRVFSITEIAYSRRFRTDSPPLSVLEFRRFVALRATADRGVIPHELPPPRCPERGGGVSVAAPHGRSRRIRW